MKTKSETKNQPRKYNNIGSPKGHASVTVDADASSYTCACGETYYSRIQLAAHLDVVTAIRKAIAALAIALVFVVGACGDNATPSPDAPIDTPDAPSTIAAMTACERYGHFECDAVKECGASGAEIDACIAKWDAICAPVTGELPVVQVDACVAALQPHGCDGTIPTFGPEAQACLASFEMPEAR